MPPLGPWSHHPDCKVCFPRHGVGARRFDVSGIPIVSTFNAALAAGSLDDVYYARILHDDVHRLLR